MNTEPLIHSFLTDCLPESHPWARKTVLCGRCGCMVHAFNNECMQAWIENDGYALCIACFRLMDAPIDPLPFKAAASSYPCVDSGE